MNEVIETLFVTFIITNVISNVALIAAEYYAAKQLRDEEWSDDERGY
jgi:hypothetical protein